MLSPKGQGSTALFLDCSYCLVAMTKSIKCVLDKFRKNSFGSNVRSPQYSSNGPFFAFLRFWAKIAKLVQRISSNCCHSCHSCHSCRWWQRRRSCSNRFYFDGGHILLEKFVQRLFPKISFQSLPCSTP